MIGYDWNDGGINNQKLALLGLFVQALSSESRSVYLPKLYSKDQHDKRSSLHPISEIYDINLIQSFADRWGISILLEPDNIVYADRISRGGWEYFGIGAGAVGNASNDKSTAYKSIAADFFRSLVPNIGNTPIAHELMAKIFGELGIDTVVQLRIEEDWYHYTQQHLSQIINKPEDYYITAPEIIAKVKATMPHTKRVYVSCDERYIFAPKWVISKEVLDATGIEIIWKSDLISHEVFDKLKPIDASILDFEIAKKADIFVGMTRSTFANLATFERFATAYRDRGSDYIYNLAGPLLGRRMDIGGTDNPDTACHKQISI